ncbi:MAG: sulfur carrier protein ThiS [Gammaproteobacteria bacterium]
MQIYVNGEQQEIASSISLADLLVSLDMSGKRVAIELNQMIIPRGQHKETLLKEGDVIEVIHAIAGG